MIKDKLEHAVSTGKIYEKRVTERQWENIIDSLTVMAQNSATTRYMALMIERFGDAWLPMPVGKTHAAAAAADDDEALLK